MPVHLADLLALAWSALVASWLFWLFGNHGYDDPYITYLYAGNLARGAGFVFNTGERVLSTTTPLYTLILAVARAAGADIPIASNVIGCVSLALGGLAFWRLGVAWRSRTVGAIGLLLYPLFPLMTSSIGAETALYMAFILFGFLAYACERYLQTAMLLALATLVRADGVLAVVAVGAHFLIARRGRAPWRAIALYAALLTPWFLFAWVYFGTPLPATLAAKQRQGLMTISERFLGGLFRQARDDYWRYPIYRPHFVLAALGVGGGLVRRHSWLLIISWSLLYTAAYTALGVTSYFWYYAPIVLGFITLIGLGVETIRRFVARVAGQRWAAGAAVLLALTLLYAQNISLRYLSTKPDVRLASYRAAGEWLRNSTPPDATVGALEVGIIGYYAERRMIDFAGLIQPDVALRITPTSTYDDIALWAIQRYQPDYLVIRPETLPRLLDDPKIKRRCHAIQSFDGPAYATPLAIYNCVRT
jgi:hypothetical protein